MKKYLKTPEEVIDALVYGKVVKIDKTCEGFDSDYRMHRNIIVETFHGRKEIVTVGGFIEMSQNPYVEIEDPKPALKLKVGKFYKTRGGEIVICAFKSINSTFIVVRQRDGHEYYVTEDGINVNRELDIIALWEEEHAEND